MTAARPKVGDIPIDSLTLEEALERICQLASAGRGGSVFTPNVDHVVLASQIPAFREAYGACSLSLIDGMPVLLAAKYLGYDVRSKVSGSDLIWPLLVRAESRNLSVYFLGGAPGSAVIAVERLRRELPQLRIAGHCAPWIDLAAPEENLLAVVEGVRKSRPDLLIVGLGAPKQELWIHRYGAHLDGTVCLALGASIDFLANRVPRAPQWLSRCGFEWVFRLAHEPRRLAYRYLLRDPRFAVILWRQLRARPVSSCPRQR